MDAGRLAVEAVEEGRVACTFPDRRALHNAMTAVAATGGSTNGILHLLAVARASGVALELDDLERINASTPVVASLTPGGRFVATDLHRVGGTAVVAKQLATAGLIDGEAPAIDGRSISQAVTEAPDPDGEVTSTVAASVQTARQLAGVCAARLRLMAGS